MTIAQQLHSSAFHKKGVDPACPLCNPSGFHKKRIDGDGRACNPQYIECPVCMRTVSLKQGATNTKGEPVMQRHCGYQTWETCGGSNLSVAAAKKKVGLA